MNKLTKAELIEELMSYGWACGFSIEQMIEDADELHGFALTEEEIRADWKVRDQDCAEYFAHYAHYADESDLDE